MEHVHCMVVAAVANTEPRSLAWRTLSRMESVYAAPHKLLTASPPSVAACMSSVVSRSRGLVVCRQAQQERVGLRGWVACCCYDCQHACPNNNRPTQQPDTHLDRRIHPLEGLHTRVIGRLRARGRLRCGACVWKCSGSNWLLCDAAGAACMHVCRLWCAGGSPAQPSHAHKQQREAGECMRATPAAAICC